MTRPIRARSARAALCAALLASAFPPPLPAQPEGARYPQELRALAKTIPEWLSRGDYPRVMREFTAQANARLPQEQLQQVWESLVRQVGPYRGVADVRMEGAAEEARLIVRCAFDRTPVWMRMTVDASQRISGLSFTLEDPAAAAADDAMDGEWLRPAATREQSIEAAMSMPAPAGVREREVAVGAGEWALPGLVTLPAGAGPFPAVILVHGSGPQDRNETVGANMPFRDLADGLADRGVAVLRYDKRTKAHRQRMAALTAFTVKEEVTDDALAAAVLLRTIGAVDARRIYVLGHSLGGMLVPRILAADPGLAGGIILAGNTRPLEELIVEQTGYLAALDGSIGPAERVQMDYVEAQAEVVKDPQLGARDTPAHAPFGMPPSYWLDLQAYHPAEAAAGLAVPLLILQGGRDYQVTMEDFEGWRRALAGASTATLKSYPLLNHLFMPGEGKSRPEEYAREGRVSGVVINDIAEWVRRQR